MTPVPHPHLLARAGLALSFLLVVACGKESTSDGLPASSRGPVIIISIDTLRADHLPMYGYDRVRTPNIDALARDGVAFENAYAHVPLTLPSHLSMLSGKLPAVHGVRNNLGYRFDAAANATIPSLLKKNGYATGAAVSAYVLRGSTGIGAAFDHYDDTMDKSEGALVGEIQRSGSRTVAAAQRWIDSNRERPFFFMLHLFEPHAPYAPPEPFRTEYAGHTYDGEIAVADAMFGQFIDFLKTKEIYNEATIILLSDHGEGLGDHGEQQHGIFLYREAVRVPLVVKLPGASRAGSRVATPVQLIDILPTIAEIVGFVPPTDLAGRSLLAIAQGETPIRRIFSESMYPRIHLGLSDLASLIDSKHHYIDAPRAELYELESDPHEKRNVLAEQRRVFAVMKREIETFPRTLAAPSNIDPEEAVKLAALGYLSAPAPSGGEGDLADPKDHIQDLERAAQASSFIESGRIGEAIAILRGVVERNPKFADGWSQLGRAYEREGRFEDSIKAYRKTIEISPMLATDSAISLAESFLSLHKIDESIQHAKLATSTHPGAAHAVLAKAYLAKKDLAAAEAEAGWLMEDPSRRVEGMVAMAQIRIAQKRLDDAESLVASANIEMKTRGAEPVAMLAFVRGDILARKGQAAEAQKAFLAETTMFPRNREAFVRLAALQTLEGRVLEAEQTFERMAKGSPGPSSFALAADVFESLGQPAAAARWRARTRKAAR